MLFPLLTLQGEHQQNGITMDNSSSSSTRTRDDESQDRDNKPAQYEESLEPDSTSIWGSRASLVDGWHKSPTSIHESKSSAPSSSSSKSSIPRSLDSNHDVLRATHRLPGR
eukprot:gb/GECG01000299.1/.p1 GENE.gb/GECG01000299.1/~~gb/GECG01000299.1/.p1  ORF type:complete len:111 (+),score=6.84 gb/GECG01000299.1/:1-333(+)